MFLGGNSPQGCVLSGERALLVVGAGFLVACLTFLTVLAMGSPQRPLGSRNTSPLFAANRAALEKPRTLIREPEAGDGPRVVPDVDARGPEPAASGSLPLFVGHGGGQAQRIGAIIVTADGVVDLAPGLLQVAQLARRARVVEDGDGLGPEQDGRFHVG